MLVGKWRELAFQLPWSKELYLASFLFFLITFAVIY